MAILHINFHNKPARLRHTGVTHKATLLKGEGYRPSVNTAEPVVRSEHNKPSYQNIIKYT